MLFHLLFISGGLMKTREFLLIATAITLLLGGCIWQVDGNAATQKNGIVNTASADTQLVFSLKTRIIRGAIIAPLDKESKVFYLATALPQSGKTYVMAIASAGRLMDEMKIGDQVEVIAEIGGLENNQARCRFIRKILNPD